MYKYRRELSKVVKRYTKDYTITRPNKHICLSVVVDGVTNKICVANNTLKKNAIKNVDRELRKLFENGRENDTGT